ncbi:FAD-dependent monooxygenase [Streptomyces zhihengii]|uniref:FAD-dependent monooxygenase n=1 Tax=Streptomyces zhihengii TaxID=1818004 RepID=UPI0036374FE1
MTGTGLRHVAVVGAGAAGAFFTLELSRLRPDVTIDLHDRDGRGPGAGIVMSTAFMDGLRPRFPGVFDLPPDTTGTWDRTLTRVGDEDIWSGAYGTVALGRRAFHARTRALAEAGPRVRAVRGTVGSAPGPADVVVVADGAGSALRRSRAEAFGTTVTEGRTHFLWASAPVRLDPQFVLKDVRPGLLVVHAYPHGAEESTFIVEADPATLAAHGLGGDRPLSETEKELAVIFADELRGAPLHAQTARWQPFRTVANSRWHDGRWVLVGDAAHTAHFSIGSGTSLAVDDALCLARLLAGAVDVPEALDAYERERRPVVEAAQSEAAESVEWFETLCRRGRVDGHRTVFALRSRRRMNTWARLRERDPEFAARTLARLAGGGAAAAPSEVPVALSELTATGRLAEAELATAAGGGGVLLVPTAHGTVRCPLLPPTAAPATRPGPPAAPAVGLLLDASTTPDPVADVSGVPDPAAGAPGGAGPVGDVFGASALPADAPGAAAVLAAWAARRGFDFLAVPVGPGAGRVSRTRRAEELTAAGVLPVVLLAEAGLPADEADTLVAAGRADLVARCAQVPGDADPEAAG